MQIIFDSAVAEELRARYTVLELETFITADKNLTAYCVVPADKIPLTEFALIDAHTQLHNAFVIAAKENNKQLCLDITEHLLGKFGGELDSFYHEVLNRFSIT
jgi:hypothetical protein